METGLAPAGHIVLTLSAQAAQNDTDRFGRKGKADIK